MSLTQPGAMDPNEPVGERFNARIEFAALLERLSHAEFRIAALETLLSRIFQNEPDPAYGEAVKTLMEFGSTTRVVDGRTVTVPVRNPNGRAVYVGPQGVTP